VGQFKAKFNHALKNKQVLALGNDLPGSYPNVIFYEGEYFTIIQEIFGCNVLLIYLRTMIQKWPWKTRQIFGPILLRSDSIATER
jgi:hypothetical protein